MSIVDISKHLRVLINKEVYLFLLFHSIILSLIIGNVFVVAVCTYPVIHIRSLRSKLEFTRERVHLI